MIGYDDHISRAGRSFSMTATTHLGKGVLVLTSVLVAACSPKNPQTLITVADARINKAQIVDIGERGDSPGDILVFDQPLLDRIPATACRQGGSVLSLHRSRVDSQSCPGPGGSRAPHVNRLESLEVARSQSGRADREVPGHDVADR